MTTGGTGGGRRETPQASFILINKRLPHGFPESVMIVMSVNFPSVTVKRNKSFVNAEKIDINETFFIDIHHLFSFRLSS